MAESKEQDPQQNTYYCNWNGSSCAMESDIIAEGFQLSEVIHGIHFLKLVGDGESSVLATIWQRVLYGSYVPKI